MLRMKLRFLITAAVVVAFDQLTKYWAATSLADQMIAVAPFLNLILVHNTGAAFGFMSDAGGWQNGFFLIVAGLASVLIVGMLWKLSDRWMGTALSLILGGAVGNLIDRLLHGHVIDFVDLYYRHWHWPAFNIADSAITVGAVMLIIDAFRPKSARPHG